MKNIYILFSLFLLAAQAYSQDNYKKLADSLRYVVDVPYIHNCSDPVLWRIVDKGLDIVPSLIDKMSDTKETDVPVRFFGGNYTIADVAYVAIQEIIGDVPTFELLGVDFDENGCGYCTYWFHLRESKKNRKKFQQAVFKWYGENKDALVWVKNSQSVTGDCLRPDGGHYEVKKTGDTTF
ncbi:hypothetical protein D0T84_02840 [Dysgonomonas sp. 521]|uniref:hypothetical protein n=1 Tax=Dysgonomonas sp. 521 TaxID=2302932 RepID=UPI0013D1750E|nr:hypothetical protein [Dysgonomonas sp. 521]NDV93855.1 hypothetical protein [Dysgonomonas sp. 521]